jgi:hypothetical protein
MKTYWPRLEKATFRIRRCANQSARTFRTLMCTTKIISKYKYSETSVNRRPIKARSRDTEASFRPGRLLVFRSA